VLGISNALTQAKVFLTNLKDCPRDGMLGIVDFSYQHYALGDALTTLMQMAVSATECGRPELDLALVVDPNKPSTDVQGFITDLNYQTYLTNIFPAFLCCPSVRSIRLFRDRESFNYMLAGRLLNRVPTWPDFKNHAHKRFPFPLGHGALNNFHAQHGYLPLQQGPRGYRRWAKQFLAEQFPDRFVVTINPRQSALTPQPATVYRDAPLPEWYRFFEHAQRHYPDVTFVMLGGFNEWEHFLAEHPNVYVMRRLGFGLAHELAILHESDLFLGTSSGFATAATFSTTPYAILNIENYFADHVGVTVGTPFYPFALDHQYLYWEKENSDLLIGVFEQIYASLQTVDQQVKSTAGAATWSG